MAVLEWRHGRLDVEPPGDGPPPAARDVGAAGHARLLLRRRIRQPWPRSSPRAAAATDGPSTCRAAWIGSTRPVCRSLCSGSASPRASRSPACGQARPCRAARMAQPLWFLAVYLIVVAIAPLFVRLHERWRWWVPLGLAMTAAVIDLAETTLPGVGWANYPIVFLFAHQLGFFAGDGTFAFVAATPARSLPACQGSERSAALTPAPIRRAWSVSRVKHART